MPNHIANRLRVIGLPDKVKEVFDFLKCTDEEGQDTLISFQKIDPMPLELLHDNGNNGLMPAWYRWRVEHWGTKWDAYDVYYESEDSIIFNTAWATPDKAISTLSRKFPDVQFEVTFADEDAGYNCGMYTFQNGEDISEDIPEGGSDEAMEYYFTMHEWAREECVKNEDGKWVWAED